MATPVAEEPTVAAAKPKRLLAKLRRLTNPAPAAAPTAPPATDAEAKGEPASTVTEHTDGPAEPDVGSSGPAASTNGSGPSGTELAAKWDEVIAQAKNRKTMMQKFKRLTSKDGKGKSKQKDQAVVEEVDIVALDPPPPPKTSSGSIPGANTLSRRIQVMLSNVPPFLNTLPDDTTTPGAPVASTSAVMPKSLAPPPIADAKLLSYLSNTRVMNGNSKGQTTTPGQPKRSVWQILDQLVPYKLATSTAQNMQGGNEDAATAAQEQSLMVVGPLVPTAESKVALAEYKIVQVETPVSILEDEKSVAKGILQSLFPKNLNVRWPWSRNPKDDPGCTPPCEPSPCPDPDPDTDPTTPGPCPSEPAPAPPPPPVPAPPPPPPPPKPTQPVKVWIPSSTEVSLQVAWWGYRIWLPEPVMGILSDKEIEATKRAAMVTTAVAWLVNNIPTSSLPAPLGAALTLLKAVVPFLGYIGGFIAWSWGEIKGFDNGKGVVLSATWLLPIALIPGTWETVEENVPVGSGSEQPVTPTPAPSTGAPSTGAPTTTPPTS